MEWLQLQPISRQESGYVEDAAATHTIRSAEDEVYDVAGVGAVHADEAGAVDHRLGVDITRRSLPTSSKSRFGRGKWKFLSRKSSWRSL